jgi:hypothetical protein
MIARLSYIGNATSAEGKTEFRFRDTLIVNH